MSKNVFLDLDGVLVNFVQGACDVHHVPWCYDTLESKGIWNLEKVLRITGNDFWAPTNNFEFWANLKMTPDGMEILGLVESKFGKENICILTSPTIAHECSGAKHYWIDKNLPEYTRRFFIGSAKEFMSGSEKILIDDSESNVDLFSKKGCAILVPRPWNRHHELETIPYLKQELEKCWV